MNWHDGAEIEEPSALEFKNHNGNANISSSGIFPQCFPMFLEAE